MGQNKGVVGIRGVRLIRTKDIPNATMATAGSR
jgi:hypothetical protein